MKYFLAIPIAHKPYIRWAEWAKSIEELAELEEFENPLIVSEDNVPAYVFGVCPWKIVSGELVERTAPEMAALEAEYNKSVVANDYSASINIIDNSTFSYGGENFPMHGVARMRYELSRGKLEDCKFLMADGTLKTISAANVAAFVAAFYDKLDELTNPDKSEE